MALFLLLLLLPAISCSPSRPNMLLLFPDEWRFDWDGFHQENGALPLNLPSLSRWKTMGTRFTHAYVPSPLCAPSRAALAAGREYDEAGVPDNFSNDFPVDKLPTFYKQLQQAGYHTMMTGKDDLTKATQLGFRIGQYLPYGRYKMSELGIDDGIRHSGKSDVIDTFPKPHEAYGYFLNNQTVLTEAGANISAFEAHYACLKNNPSKCDRLSYPDRLYEDNWVAQNALELLDRKPRDTPWFMHVSFPGPHPAFLVTARMADTVGNRTWPQPVDTKKKDTCRNKPHEPANGNRCNYGAEIENLDRLFGMVVSKVESLGELEDTIVCISSDHGEMLGDHGGWAKSKPWEASASVPLLCWGEKFGIVANATISTPVSTLDLAGTFMDYGGAKPAPGMTTASLRPMLVGSEAPVRSFISSGLQNWRMAVQNVNGTNFKFICCKGSCPNPPSNVGKPKHGWTQLLYAIEQDQFDMNELSGKHPDVVETMRPLLPASFGCGKK